MRKSATASVLAAVGVLLPGIVFAHTDVGPVTGFAAGFTHPIGGADHVLAMVAVGLWAAQLGGRARWIVPGAFLGAMVLAGALGIAGVTLPLVEAGVLASVLVLGVLITASLSVPAAVGSLLVAAFAVFHGHAHGTEMPLALGGLAYSAGFAAATAFLHASGITAGVLLKALGLRKVARAAGALIVVAGIFLTVA
jgi:urease accessory protein